MPSRRPRSHTVVGVAIDGDVLRGVQLRRALAGITAERAAEVEIDPAAVQHGRIVDAAAVSAGLRRLWEAGEFDTRNVAFGIDGRDAMFRRLSLPLAAANDLETAARYELAEYLPYDLDEAVVDVHEVDRHQGGVEVVVEAVRVATTQRILDMVKDAGLRLSELALEPSALGSAVAESDPGGSAALVVVEGASTTILLRRSGRATVARVLSSGGGGRSTEVADELADALATVDRFRAGRSDDAVTSDAREDRFRAAAREVAAAISFELTEHEAFEAPTSVLLAGAHGASDSLLRHMGEAVNAAIGPLPTPGWWSLDEDYGSFIGATGLALSAVRRDADSAGRLDPPTAVARRKRRFESLVGGAVALLVAVLASQMVVAARTSASGADGAAIDAESRADLVGARLDALEELSVLEVEVGDRRLVVQEALEAEISWRRLLEEIANAIPEDTFLTGASLRRPAPEAVDQDVTASFTGIALDQSGVARWLLAVRDVDGIDDVWLVQSTSAVYGEDELPVVSFIAEADLTDALLTDRARPAASVGADR